MGYQETLVTTKNPEKFNKLIEIYKMALRDGYYKQNLAEPLSVVQLKINYESFKKGTKFMYFLGERRSQETAGDCFGKFVSHLFDEIDIIPIEEFIDFDDFGNIDFSVARDENDNLIVENIKLYN